VASLATERRVLPDQREASQIVIESYSLEPAPVVVTARTGFTQATLVNVVLPMTTVATCLQLAFADAADMAGFTNQFGVPTPQRKVGVGVMVEGRLLPALDVVAVLAVFTVRPFMNVVGAMAAVTIAHLAPRLRRLVARPMATVTGLAAMPAEQRVVGVTQVIEACLLPGFYRVTLLAFVTESIRVYVSYRVTVAALVRRILVLAADVTGVAGHLLV